MGEKIEEVQELKMKELRALMKLGWETDIDQNQLVEKSLDELTKILQRKDNITDPER